MFKSQEEARAIIKNSLAGTQVLKKLKRCPNSYNLKKLKDYIKEHNICTEHFTGNGQPKQKLKSCPVCEKEFRSNSATTCSKGCANTYFRSGVNNPNWLGNNYTAICWQHHEKKCIVCSEDKIVAVHHYDENHNNNDPANLVPLCPTHHLYWHSKYQGEIKDIVDNYIKNFKYPV